jgi:hypothetical protein
MALIAKAARRYSPIWLCAASLVSLPLLGGCATVGDLGRLNDRWPGPATAVAADAHVTGAISGFPLTDDEKHLRKLAANLLTPPVDQSRWYLYGRSGGRSVPPPPVTGAFDGEAYVTNLLEGPFRSATSRYARLIDDIRNDTIRIEPFLSTARRVADMDRKRDRSLGHVAVLVEGEVANAQLRIRENISCMISVHAALAERVAAYRFALERLVVALPSPVAAEAERLWSELARRVGDIQVLAKPVVAAQAPASK